MDDAEIIRDVARAVATMAQELRAESTRVAQRAMVRWSGSAAAQYHSQIHDRAVDYRQLSGDLDRLHDALLSHARHVEDHERALSNLLQVSNPVELLVPGISW
ncbi:hypothetical protein [Branchiibius sp. NY16-3462-2]|uniref:WXG100 family type VII secretion target n=1 Tax=Branchiibius sp. NY16-3462-2 TaxID=1807500 RepID=UPI000794F5D6|nr:hypothetical protein [Branchiibius sp. NY16-3462-2]KYH45002.1 hypothetical protein AZH51_14010 [Branchiibius sp. NY16-3462-2]